MTAPWIWNDETEECAARLVHSFSYLDTRTGIVKFISAIQRELGERTDLDMAASAAAAHLSGHPWRLRKRPPVDNIGKLP